MSDAVEDLEAAARHLLVRLLPVGCRDDRIAPPPDDHRRYEGGEMQPVGRADPLPARVDDRPDGVDERAASSRVGERAEGLEHLRDVRPGLEAAAGQNTSNG